MRAAALRRAPADVAPEELGDGVGVDVGADDGDAAGLGASGLLEAGGASDVGARIKSVHFNEAPNETISGHLILGLNVGRCLICPVGWSI